jgi:hypothetical protein
MSLQKIWITCRTSLLAMMRGTPGKPIRQCTVCSEINEPLCELKKSQWVAINIINQGTILQFYLYYFTKVKFLQFNL